VTQKDTHTLTREIHAMVALLCKKVEKLEKIEPILGEVPAMCKNTRENLAEFRRDMRTRLRELAEVVRMSVKGR
jgi:hypothetical protein